MSYVRQKWIDGADGQTPLDAERLTYMENGIYAAQAAADQAETDAMSTLGTAATALNASSLAQSQAQTAQALAASALDAANAALGRVTGASVTGVQVQNVPLIVVRKTDGTWPARPTSDPTVVVIWQGQDPSPAIVTSGTGGMLDGKDVRWVIS